MYHPLPITANNPPGPGTFDYLQFNLTTITTDMVTERETTTMRAYFHLKHALCQLLETDLRHIDPNVARFSGLDHSLRAYVRTPDNYNDYATLIYHHPHSDNSHKITPGIYLYSDLLSNEQIYTTLGQPMPAAIKTAFPFNMPLAYLDRHQRGLVLLEHYEKLRNYATEYLQMLQSVTNGMDHQLVIKGQYRSRKSQEGKFVQHAKYVEHHYFDNAQRPVQALLDTNLLSLDGYVADQQQQKHHQHVYTLGVDQQLTGSIQVVRIGDDNDKYPTAGIYLLAYPDLHTLEKTTGIPFSRITHCDTSSGHLLLASYHYNFGYSLEPGDGLLQLMQQQQLNRSAETHHPAPTYTAISTYEFREGPDTLQPFKHATAFFHYDRPSLALLQLLSLDFALFCTSNPNSPHKMSLQGAGVQDSAGAVLAHLQKIPGPEQGLHQVILVLEGALATIVAAAHHPPRTDDIHTSGEAVHLRMGHFNAEGVFEHAHDNLNFLKGLLQQPISMLDHAMQVHQPILMPETPTKPFIALQWQHGNQPPGSGTVTHIVRHSLEDAHQFLLAIDPKWFCPDPDHPGVPHLLNAHLFDGGDPQMMAIRYYLPMAIGSVPEGYYIHYNADSAKALALPSGQPSLERIETASSDHYHTYRHQTKLTPSVEGLHLRVFARQEPGKGQGL
ncbi:hypothetical protein HB364_13850 [Pseudoflavitalea sp. X16]|uniref:hypothetical protein n=1 Tax=Paraflavitalea devenefica TaxID=2716334 RepID=UPI00141FBD9C|nr:hypothetical protein [Paraflavitalea devenefica]NII26172.1 hypothetical protein [Paraflavitalea devenefica]